MQSRAKPCHEIYHMASYVLVWHGPVFYWRGSGEGRDSRVSWKVMGEWRERCTCSRGLPGAVVASGFGWIMEGHDGSQVANVPDASRARLGPRFQPPRLGNPRLVTKTHGSHYQTDFESPNAMIGQRKRDKVIKHHQDHPRRKSVRC